MSVETWSAHASAHPAVVLTFELSELGLLGGCQDLVEGRLSFRLVHGRLRRESADRGGRLFDPGYVIRLHGGLQCLVRGRHAAVYRGVRAGRISEYGGGLLLLRRRQAQKSGQVIDTVLDKVARIAAVGRVLSD